VISTTVISITLKMDGKNLNGVGQSVLAVRRYPYPKSIAPNVQASDRMNNHIASLREGMANGDGSIAAECPSAML
jgi:hypothetical protein